MGRKKTGAMPTATPKPKQKMVIDMMKVELAKAYQVPAFRTGKHITEKDRPRKKNWKREYESGKESDSYGKYGCGSFLLEWLQPINMDFYGNGVETCRFVSNMVVSCRGC